jgi:hypothetical protein
MNEYTKEVDGRRRNSFLHKQCGTSFVTFERAIYGTASHWDSKYTGGLWKFIETKGTNEETGPVNAWFMFFEDDGLFKAKACFEEVETDSLTWSVALNMMVFCNLANSYSDQGNEQKAELFTGLYYELREAAYSNMIPNLDTRALYKILD